MLSTDMTALKWGKCMAARTLQGEIASGSLKMMTCRALYSLYGMECLNECSNGFF